MNVQVIISLDEPGITQGLVVGNKRIEIDDETEKVVVLPLDRKSGSVPNEFFVIKLTKPKA